MTRWKASGIHLATSIVVAIVVILLLSRVWFPGPLFEATGSRELSMMLIAIDVALGPLVTLIVYRAGKPGMKFDLAFIAVCQLAALAYGLNAFLTMRPAYTVFAVDRFVSVPATNLSREDLEAASDPAYRTLPWTGPRLVAAKMPTDPAERQALMDSGFAGKDVERFPKYYEPYENQRARVLEKSRPLENLSKLEGEDKATLDRFLASHGGDPADYAYLPMSIPRGFMIAVVRRADAGFVGILPIEPPPEPTR